MTTSKVQNCNQVDAVQAALSQDTAIILQRVSDMRMRVQGDGPFDYWAAYLDSVRTLAALVAVVR